MVRISLQPRNQNLITFDDANALSPAASLLCTHDSLYRPSCLRYDPATTRLRSHGEVLD